MKILALVSLFLFGLFLFFRAQRLIRDSEHTISVLGINDQGNPKPKKKIPPKSINDTIDNFDIDEPSKSADVLNLTKNGLSIPEELIEYVYDYNHSESLEAKYQALLVLIDLAYRKRKEGEYVEFGASLIDEFSNLIELLVKEGKTNEIQAEGHKQLSMLLVEFCEFNYALDLCTSAMVLGLDDGTVTGFSGRIKRITKLKERFDSTIKDSEI